MINENTEKLVEEYLKKIKEAKSIIEYSVDSDEFFELIKNIRFFERYGIKLTKENVKDYVKIINAREADISLIVPISKFDYYDKLSMSNDEAYLSRAFSRPLKFSAIRKDRQNIAVDFY